MIDVSNTIVRPGGENFARWPAADRLRCFFPAAAAAAILLVSTGDFVEAASIRQGVSAFNRQDYAAASPVFIRLAEHGDPAAQAYLGFLFETGRGVPPY